MRILYNNPVSTIFTTKQEQNLYPIELDKKYTINSFIKTILRKNKNDHGTITIILPNSFKHLRCQYESGCAINHLNISKYMDDIVNEAFCLIGDNSTDYELYLK